MRILTHLKTEDSLVWFKSVPATKMLRGIRRKLFASIKQAFITTVKQTLTNRERTAMYKSNQGLALLINEIEVINMQKSDASRLAEGFKDMSSKERDESLTTRHTLKERYDDIVVELHDKYDIRLPMYNFIIKMREAD